MFVDWYGFTLELPAAIGKVSMDTMQHVEHLLTMLPSGVGGLDLIHGRWQVSQATEGGTAVMVHGTTGLYVKIQPNTRYVAVDLSGKVCQVFRTLNLLDDLIRKTAYRASRVDIAVDLESDITPRDIAFNLDNERMKVTGQEDSSSGQTIYVGSRNSERYAAIYRYFEPHPRAHLLRFEMRHKKRTARHVAQEIAVMGVSDVGRGLLARYQPKYYMLRDIINGHEVTTITPDHRVRTGRYRWLLETVPVALERAVKEGEIDFDVWVAEMRKRLQKTGL